MIRAHRKHQQQHEQCFHSTITIHGTANSLLHQWVTPVPSCSTSNFKCTLNIFNASKNRLYLIVIFVKELKNVLREGDASLGFMIITHSLYCSACFHTARPHYIHKKASGGRLTASSFHNNLSQSLTPLFCLYYTELLCNIKHIY